MINEILDKLFPYKVAGYASAFNFASLNESGNTDIEQSKGMRCYWTKRFMTKDNRNKFLKKGISPEYSPSLDINTPHLEIKKTSNDKKIIYVFDKYIE
ncbi:MAG: hypothetical protein WC755_00045 [Candidatus Woesearchaeota archaeon]|jgi:hypothetical protein